MSLERSLAIHLHKTSPWIPNFKRILVRYITQVPWQFLGQDVRIGTEILNEPTDEFWWVHVNSCHPNNCRGCSIGCHVAFLTAQGKIADFEYGAQLTDGTYRPFTREDFEIECRWWSQNFARLVDGETKRRQGSTLITMPF